MTMLDQSLEGRRLMPVRKGEDPQVSNAIDILIYSLSRIQQGRPIILREDQMVQFQMTESSIEQSVASHINPVE